MSDGFLGRWSRRKIEARVEARSDSEVDAKTRAATPPGEEAERPVDEGSARVEGSQPAAPGGDEPEAARVDALTEEELAALPPIESFTLETDITPFLRRGVPKALKNAAMRKMWLLDPAIRDYRDVALDYAYDWNTPGGVPGNAGSITREAARRMLDAMRPPVVSPDAPTAGEPAVDFEGADAAQRDAAGESAAPEETGEAAPASAPAEKLDTAVRGDAEGAASDLPSDPREPEAPARSSPGVGAHHVEEPRETAFRKRRHGKATPV